MTSYQTALNLLAETPRLKWQDHLVLEVLRTRDELQICLNVILSEPTPSYTDALLQLATADARLETLGPKIADYPSFKRWRKTLMPPSSAWWWHFEPTAESWAHFNWLWNTVTVTILAANLAVVTDLATRFLSGDPGIFSSFAAIAPGILTLASGGAFTKGGQKFIDGLLRSWGLGHRYWQLTKFLLVLSWFGLLYGFHYFLPTIARQYLKQGEQQYAQHNLAAAQDNFERALKLYPDYPEAQFFLGVVYEDLLSLDDAKTEYKRSIQAGYIPSYNNLARLHIIQTEDDQAVVLLNQALALINPELDSLTIQYALYKNLGWAQFNKGNLAEAQASLEFALELDLEGGQDTVEAHCLLAQVFEQQKSPDEALKEWEDCLQYLVPFDQYSQQWFELASQRLAVIE
ncbi:MAG: tetratricopeptide repeat protein [Cyanobacteria bacterium P01_G01_bin.54]